MPKKLPPEIIKFRESLEAIRKQYEEGPVSAQSKRIDAAITALKGVKADIIQLGKYVDEIIATLDVTESADTVTTESSAPPMDTAEDAATLPCNDIPPVLPPAKLTLEELEQVRANIKADGFEGLFPSVDEVKA